MFGSEVFDSPFDGTLIFVVFRRGDLESHLDGTLIFILLSRRVKDFPFD